MWGDETCYAEDIGGNLGGPCTCSRCATEQRVEVVVPPSRVIVADPEVEQLRATAESLFYERTIATAAQYAGGIVLVDPLELSGQRMIDHGLRNAPPPLEPIGRVMTMHEYAAERRAQVQARKDATEQAFRDLQQTAANPLADAKDLKRAAVLYTMALARQNDVYIDHELEQLAEGIT